MEDKMDKKIYVPGNGYRVLVKKGELWIGSMRFKSYNKAYSHASKVEKALPDCTVLLVKVCKGELSLVKSYEEGRGEKNTLMKCLEDSLSKSPLRLLMEGIRMKEIAEAVKNGAPIGKELTSNRYKGHEINVLRIYKDDYDSNRLVLYVEIPSEGVYMAVCATNGEFSSYSSGFSPETIYADFVGLRCVYEG